MQPAFKYIYGPVFSWRLGSSLGIDLLSPEEKICNFDCVYCQLGPTQKHTAERKNYVPVEKVVEELGALPAVEVDYITFAGRGEPALADNLGKAIRAVKILRRERVALLTNGSLLGSKDLREDIFLADFIIAKLDAYSPDSLRQINNPIKGLEFDSVVDGIRRFKQNYRGKLALQIMFIDINKHEVDKYAHLANDLKPDEIQINTPLRPSKVAPLMKEEIVKMKDHFSSVCKGINVVSIYDEREFMNIASLSDEDTLKRRGKVKA